MTAAWVCKAHGWKTGPNGCVWCYMEGHDAAMQVNRVIKTPIGVEVESSDEKGLSREPAKGADAPKPNQLCKGCMCCVLVTNAAQESMDDGWYRRCPGCGTTFACMRGPSCEWLTSPPEKSRASPIKAEVTTGEAATTNELPVNPKLGVRELECELERARDCALQAWLDFLAAIEKDCAGRDKRIERLIAHGQRVQADSRKWHLKYKSEAGGMRGEIKLLCAANASLRAKLDEAERERDRLNKMVIDMDSDLHEQARDHQADLERLWAEAAQAERRIALLDGALDDIGNARSLYEATDKIWKRVRAIRQSAQAAEGGKT